MKGKGIIMITNELNFATERPSWATTTDAASGDACAHVRDYSFGDVTLEIRQQDHMADLQTVHGQPELVLGVNGEQITVTPQLLARLAKSCMAAAETFARITR